MSTEENGPGSGEVADLKSAIRAVARAEASADPERKRLIDRAAELKYAGLVPGASVLGVADQILVQQRPVTATWNSSLAGVTSGAAAVATYALT